MKKILNQAIYIRNKVHLEFGLRFSTARCVPDERLDDHLLFRTSSYEALCTMYPVESDV